MASNPHPLASVAQDHGLASCNSQETAAPSPGDLPGLTRRLEVFANTSKTALIPSAPGDFPVYVMVP